MVVINKFITILITFKYILN